MQRFFTLCLFLALALMVPTYALAQGGCCVEPDNGSGTATMPPNCTYFGPMVMNVGFPVGSYIDINAELKSFFGVNEVPGGALGGSSSTFSALLEMTMVGQGGLAGFNRVLFVPITGVMEFAPRVSGAAVQTFAGDVFDLTGDLFGDPDFCTLRVRAGTSHGLPSPGSSTLTRLGTPGSPFQVDSFFDIHYTIEFQGCPGSILEGFGGTTNEIDRFETCPSPVPVEDTTWGGIKRLQGDR